MNYINHNNPITYEEAKLIVNKIIEYYKIQNINLEPVGSFARESEWIGDLDFITGDTISGDRRYIKTIFQINDISIGVDIWRYEPEEEIIMRFSRTGTKKYQMVSRVQAKRKGYHLTDKTLEKIRTGERVYVKSEKELFELIGRTYKPVWQRLV